MLIKFLLKIWPSLIPFLLYFLWIKLRKKNSKIIDATYQEVDRDGNPKSDQLKSQAKSPGDFSLQNRRFVTIVYVSLVIAIICFLFFAIRVPHVENGKYIPAEIRDGKIVPGKVVE